MGVFLINWNWGTCQQKGRWMGQITGKIKTCSKEVENGKMAHLSTWRHTTKSAIQRLKDKDDKCPLSLLESCKSVRDETRASQWSQWSLCYFSSWYMCKTSEAWKSLRFTDQIKVEIQTKDALKMRKGRVHQEKFLSQNPPLNTFFHILVVEKYNLKAKWHLILDAQNSIRTSDERLGNRIEFLAALWFPNNMLKESDHTY